MTGLGFQSINTSSIKYPRFVELLNSAVLVNLCNRTFIQNISYEYISDPAILADIGNLSLIFSNFCLIANISQQGYSLSVSQIFLSIGKLSANIDSVADLPRVL